VLKGQDGNRIFSADATPGHNQNAINPDGLGISFSAGMGARGGGGATALLVGVDDGIGS
jgi:hypothetical protein